MLYFNKGLYASNGGSGDTTKYVVLTQDEYDALTTKDEDTFYYIKEEA